MQPVDFLGDSGGPLMDTAGNFGIKRLPLEGMPQDRLGISLLLKFDVGVSTFSGHTSIFR